MKSILVSLVTLVVTSSCLAESITICDVPQILPRGTGLNSYSPRICFEYSGLQTGKQYDLVIWLLTPDTSPWDCASTQWCERHFPIDNSSGTNAEGTIEVIEDMDVYSYSQFDWVVRLYQTGGSEVASVVQPASSTENRAPTLTKIDAGTVGIHQALHLSVGASDPENGPLIYSITPLPSGATFNASTGEFSWTPDQAGTYSFLLEVADDEGLADAQALTLSVVAKPVITEQPQSQVARLKDGVVFNVTSSDLEPLTYQWQFNGNDIPGATSTSVDIPKVETNNAGSYHVIVSNSSTFTISDDAILTVALKQTAKNSARASINHLIHEMDLFHKTFQVYTDISAPGNHFHARGQLPDEKSDVNVNGSWSENPHSGATCIRCEYVRHTNDFGGFYFMNGILVDRAPLPYFGETNIAGTSIQVTNFTGLNLQGASSLTFWGRGEHGGEQVEFFMGGVGRDARTGEVEPDVLYPDSTPRYPPLGTVVTLNTNWRQYVISLKRLNLTNIMGGFAWVADSAHNPNGAVFYVDDIEYHLTTRAMLNRLKEPRLIRSYVTLPVQPSLHDGNPDNDVDLVLRNTAYTYDNALAILAFLANHSTGSLKRARMIGDAMVYAVNHDRSYTDGRFRTAYSAGDIALPPGWDPNGKKATVPVPGYYTEDSQTFFELLENADVDTGNNAWAMIALLALYERTHDTNYLGAARNVGVFIQQFRNNTGLYQGFLGGITNAEGVSPVLRTYASTEHNLDINAACSRMFEITGESVWNDMAEHARQFIESMWDTNRGCYYAGTLGDPNIRNEITGQLPLDTHSWAILSLSNALVLHPLLLLAPETYHRTISDGFTGFDFNDDRDGVWFEGTGQMGVAYAFAHRQADAEVLRDNLRSAQQIPAPFGNGLGIVAASHDGVSSGFNFKLFRRLHVGATAWNVFCQVGFNPFYQTVASR